MTRKELVMKLESIGATEVEFAPLGLAFIINDIGYIFHFVFIKGGYRIREYKMKKNTTKRFIGRSISREADIAWTDALPILYEYACERIGLI